MSKETEALLRSILYQVEKASSVTEIRHAIRAMCSKDDISSVMHELAEEKKEKEKS